MKLDFNKKLSPKTIGDILLYLERRPLGEVYALFEQIKTELIKDANGAVTDNQRTGTTPSGGWDPALGNSGVPSVPAEPGNSGS